MSSKYRWSITNLVDGKKFFFKNWRDMTSFVNDQIPSKGSLVQKDGRSFRVFQEKK